MSKTYQATRFLQYWLDSMDKHSLQSPFIYELYNHVIRPGHKSIIVPEIEKTREKLKADKRVIAITDFGAGSKVDNGKNRKVSDIAMKGISQRKYSEIFMRLISFLGAQNIVELGTSLGINTLYLAKSDDVRVTTFEGAQSLCQLASEAFKSNNKSNIKVVPGNIDHTLPEFLKSSNKLDVVYFDANHQYQSTINYFNWCKKLVHQKSCFILDDIHLSKEMGRAWREIHNHYEVSVSIDLFQVGIVFFNPEMTKQHYVLAC